MRLEAPRTIPKSTANKSSIPRAVATQTICRWREVVTWSGDVEWVEVLVYFKDNLNFCLILKADWNIKLEKPAKLTFRLLFVLGKLG